MAQLLLKRRSSPQDKYCIDVVQILNSFQRHKGLVQRSPLHILTQQGKVYIRTIQYYYMYPKHTQSD